MPRNFPLIPQIKTIAPTISPGKSARRLTDHAESEMIDDLKVVFTRYDKSGWTVQPNEAFGDALKRVDGLPKSGIIAFHTSDIGPQLLAG